MQNISRAFMIYVLFNSDLKFGVRVSTRVEFLFIFQTFES